MMTESETAQQANAIVETPKAEQRQDRGPRTGEPRGRGERGPRGERAERGGEGRGEARPEGGRGEGRGERRPRQDETARPAEEQGARMAAPESETTTTVMEAGQAGRETSPGTIEQAPQGEGTREKRSRDRYGRDRHERGDRAPREPREETPAQTEAAAALEGAVVERPREIPRAAAPAAAAPQAPVAAPAARQLPRIQPFMLPLSELSQVAQSSGLQWVNSDATKVATVQAAIAAEPKPLHVPRARPAPVVIDEGPLILVETRRDLRNLPLPQEQP